MNKYLFTLSNDVTTEYYENDNIDLIVAPEYMAPKIHKCSETNKKTGNIYNYIRVRSFDLENLKMSYKKFMIKDNNTAEKDADEYFNSLSKYDSLNIEQYSINIPIIQVIDNLKFYKTYLRYYNRLINFDIKNIPIDPYIFGVWLGDGNSADCGITNIDPEIIDAYIQYCNDIKLNIHKYKINYRATNIKPYRHLTNKDTIIDIIKDIDNKMPRKDVSLKYNVDTGLIMRYYNLYKNGGIDAINKLYDSNIQNVFNLNLKNLNVINNKHIPEIYKKNSKEIRLQLLAGFIDTDGYLDHGSSYEIVQGIKNVKIFDDIKEVAESLGFKVSRKECIKTCLYNGEKKECPAIKGNISGDVHIIPVRIERKKITKIKTQRYDLLKFDIKLL
jgi:intein/homing endonuclease